MPRQELPGTGSLAGPVDASGMAQGNRLRIRPHREVDDERRHALREGVGLVVATQERRAADHSESGRRSHRGDENQAGTPGHRAITVARARLAILTGSQLPSTPVRSHLRTCAST